MARATDARRLAGRGVVAVAAAAAVLVACQHDNIPDCKPSTLQIQAILYDTANDADAIRVHVDSPDFVVTAAHTPGGNMVQYIDVAFPDGYPAGNVVTVQVEARQHDALLADNELMVRLPQRCVSVVVPLQGGITVIPRDGGASD